MSSGNGHENLGTHTRPLRTQVCFPSQFISLVMSGFNRHRRPHPRSTSEVLRKAGWSEHCWRGRSVGNEVRAEKAGEKGREMTVGEGPEAEAEPPDMHWGLYWFSLKFLPKAGGATPVNSSINILSGARVSLNAQQGWQE